MTRVLRIALLASLLLGVACDRGPKEPERGITWGYVRASAEDPDNILETEGTWRILHAEPPRRGEDAKTRQNIDQL